MKYDITLTIETDGPVDGVGRGISWVADLLRDPSVKAVGTITVREDEPTVDMRERIAPYVGSPA